MYDDKAVAQLLDRAQICQEEREIAMNEYLDSFKVASYSTKGGDEVCVAFLIPDFILSPSPQLVCSSLCVGLNKFQHTHTHTHTLTQDQDCLLS